MSEQETRRVTDEEARAAVTRLIVKRNSTYSDGFDGFYGVRRTRGDSYESEIVADEAALILYAAQRLSEREQGESSDVLEGLAEENAHLKRQIESQQLECVNKHIPRLRALDKIKRIVSEGLSDE